MKYVVTGQNRETGARMSLEFDAESKAAAERKAGQSGMSVHRVVDVTDGYPSTAAEPGGVRRRSSGGGASRFLLLLLLLIAAAAAAYYFLPQVRALVGRG